MFSVAYLAKFGSWCPGAEGDFLALHLPPFTLLLFLIKFNFFSYEGKKEVCMVKVFFKEVEVKLTDNYFGFGTKYRNLSQ